MGWHGRVRGLIPVVALVMSAVTPAVARVGATGGLAGTWRVSRRCSTGCHGSSTVVEQVRPHGHNVYVAGGGLVLYESGNQVLVHSSAASSLLTIRVPGQLMDGVSLQADGSIRSVTWRCLAPFGGSSGAVHARPNAPSAQVVAAPAPARVRC